MSETRSDNKPHSGDGEDGSNFLDRASNPQRTGNTYQGRFLEMAAEILRFSTEKELPVITGTHSRARIASELIEALGELAVAQERGGSRERLACLGRSVDAAVRQMSEYLDIDSAA